MLTPADKQFARVVSGVRAKQSKFDRLLDEIKDEIDTLHDIRSKKRREDAARELIEYIELHHL